MRRTVLVVEGETKLCELVRSFLEREGLSVLTTGSGVEALALQERVAPDVVVLDLGLPDLPGDVVAREVRRRSDVLLLMLTARAPEDDRVLGLELGADDYLTKPFSPRELVLRVHAMLRRGRSTEAPAGPASYGSGRLVVDDVGHDVCSDGELVRLSPTEWSILETLARTPGRVYSRYELVNSARGYEQEGYERVVDSHVKNLRHKLGDDGREPRIIETVVGVGYRLGLSLDR